MNADLSALSAAAHAASAKAAQSAAELGRRRVTVESDDRTVKVVMNFFGDLEDLVIAEEAPRKLGSAGLARVLQETLRAAQEQATSAYRAAVHDAAPEVRAYQDALKAGIAGSRSGVGD